ncbi:tRNA-dependent cyclodipeptide synthase [Embleya sp. NPDC001921]
MSRSVLNQSFPTPSISRPPRSLPIDATPRSHPVDASPRSRPVDAGPRPLSFAATPYSATCRSIWDRGEHLLIGVSPGNGYFTPQRVAALLAWADPRFAAIDVVYADLHVDTMFETFGYTPEHAARRAAKDLKAVRRRVLRGVEEAGTLSRVPGVHALSEFADDPVYRELHDRARIALREDGAVRRACDDMVREFLAPRLRPGDRVTPEQRRACVAYIAAELPFFVDTPAILGVASSVSCYHSVLPMTGVLFGATPGADRTDGRADACDAFRARPNQAYALVRPDGVDA